MGKYNQRVDLFGMIYSRFCGLDKPQRTEIAQILLNLNIHMRVDGENGKQLGNDLKQAF